MKIVVTALMTLCFAGFAFAQNEAYVTPDSWSKHITANGVSASSNGLTIGGANLKIGLTTRGQLRFSGDNDGNIYQYVRARLSGLELGSGYLNINLNMRGAWDSNPRVNPREYYVYYDGMDVSRNNADVDFRLYQGNIEFDNVLKYTNLQIGRVYLSTFNSYKIDGGNLSVQPLDWLKLNVFYGLPVSYYSDLNTQVVGGGLDFPIDATGTRIRGEYSYFMHNDGGDYNTSVGKARIDQTLPYTHVYAEGSVIGNAWTYDIGLDGNLDMTRTGLSAYVMGQYDKNKNEINPYVAMYESELGAESEYVMGGFQLTQGVTDYVMVGVGFEGRYNFNESYGDRDYYRVFGTLDLVGLIHRENFLSIIADYYTVAKYKRQDENSKLMVGLRMTQRITDSIDMWLGANVMNYQYHASPIKYYQGETGFSGISQKKEDENTTLAYIGGMWQPTDWCVLQLDYTFEYSDIFKKEGFQSDIQTVELWVNFLW